MSMSLIIATDSPPEVGAVPGVICKAGHRVNGTRDEGGAWWIPRYCPACARGALVPPSEASV